MPSALSVFAGSCQDNAGDQFSRRWHRPACALILDFVTSLNQGESPCFQFSEVFQTVDQRAHRYEILYPQPCCGGAGEIPVLVGLARQLTGE